MYKRMDIVVQRQLESLKTGNNAYLKTFLQAAKRADLVVRVVFAPRRSFGNRPWASIHSGFDAVIDEVKWPGTVKIGSKYWSLSPRVWARFALRIVKEGMRRMGMDIGIHSYLGTPLEPREEAEVARACLNNPADIVIAEYSSLAPLLNRLMGIKTRGVLMHDLMSARAEQFEENDLEPNFLVITLEDELEWVRAANLLIFASADEMARFGSQMPRARSVWLCPEPPVYEVDINDAPARVVFLGTRHAGNTDAINHFLEDIWPRVHARLPQLECWIVGSTSKDVSPDYHTLDGVKLMGRVDRLPDIGGPASIGVAPARLASGVSIKVAEYLMLGMNCVAYPKALQGFGDALNDLVVIANDPDVFADEIVRLAKDEKGRSEHSRSAPGIVAQIGQNVPVVTALRELAMHDKGKA